MDNDLRWFLIYKYVSQHEMYVSQNAPSKEIYMRLSIWNSKNYNANGHVPHLSYLTCSRNISLGDRSIHMLNCQFFILKNYVAYVIHDFITDIVGAWNDVTHLPTFAQTRLTGHITPLIVHIACWGFHYPSNPLTTGYHPIWKVYPQPKASSSWAKISTCASGSLWEQVALGKNPQKHNI